METPKQMNANEAAISTLLLGKDGDWWDCWMFISLGLGALVAAAVGAFTVGSAIVHKREAAAASAALERYKAEAANEAARLHNDTARLTGENLGLQQLLAARHIIFDTTSSERAPLYAAVKTFSATRVFIQYVPDFEAIRLGYEIAEKLRQAGWKPEFMDEKISHFGPLFISDGVAIHSTNDAFAAGQAVARLFALDLGEGPGKLVLQNDISLRAGPFWGPPGFQAPENSLVILVGIKETWFNIQVMRIRAAEEAEKAQRHESK